MASPLENYLASCSGKPNAAMTSYVANLQQTAAFAPEIAASIVNEPLAQDLPFPLLLAISVIDMKGLPLVQFFNSLTINCLSMLLSSLCLVSCFVLYFPHRSSVTLYIMASVTCDRDRKSVV